METPATNGNRVWGALQLLGGALETAAGIGCGAATAWTGVGAAAGGAVALHGADSVVAGAREVWSGRDHDTFTSQGITHVSGSRTAGEFADAGIGILGTMGVGAFSKVAKAEPLVAKTVRWTDRLLPGSGETGTYGDILVSRLGSKLDRMQVLLHEKVHSFLSPAADSWFASARASLRSFLYSESNLMRYAEEALAESYAQLGSRGLSGMSVSEALRAGIAFPIEYGYLTKTGLATEAAGAAGKLSSTANQVWEAQ